MNETEKANATAARTAITAAEKPAKTEKTHKLAGSMAMFGGLSIQERINFARHLSMVVKAGLPIFKGLTIIRAQAASKVLQRIVDQVLSDVNNGKFLADSLERYKDIFGEFFINIVRVGEASGTLSQNLLYLADELKKSKELRSKVRGAMIYPLIILLATLGLTSFLAFFILPKLLPVLYGLKVALPPTTKILLAAVDFATNYGLATLGIAVAAVIGFRIAVKRIIPFRYLMHRLIFFMPVISSLVVAVNMVTFSRVLGMLLKSGVKIVEAVNITLHTLPNLVYQDLLTKANEEVKRGGQLATILAKHPGFFPVLLSGMIQVGENTGNLEENLFYVSEYYDEEVTNNLRNLTSFLEPVMLLFMGGLVGFVAISIITPIYSLSQGVN